MDKAGMISLCGGDDAGKPADQPAAGSASISLK